MCVRTLHPAVRSASATLRPPRLLSTKNSGRERHSGTEVVLDIFRRNTEILGDMSDRLPRLPATDNTLHRSGTPDKHRLTEGAMRVDDDDPAVGRGRNKPLRPVV